jgi:hypothetical protein
VVVQPPCDAGNIIERWARDSEHEILPPPRRQDLLRSNPAGTLDLRGKGLLVIPRLENWFLRQRNGLFAVRSLLAQLELLRRRRHRLRLQGLREQPDPRRSGDRRATLPAGRLGQDRRRLRRGAFGRHDLPPTAVPTELRKSGVSRLIDLRGGR